MPYCMSSTVLNNEHLWCSVHRRELPRVMSVTNKDCRWINSKKVFGRHSIYNLLPDLGCCDLGIFKLVCFIVCFTLANKVWKLETSWVKIGLVNFTLCFSPIFESSVISYWEKQAKTTQCFSCCVQNWMCIFTYICIYCIDIFVVHR
jgi:hypothetical protein